MSEPWPAPCVVRVGAFGIAYHDEGSGPPLLLVHGLGSSSLAWARVFDTLAEAHRVIAPDLPGFGDSDKPRYRYTIPFYAERLLRLMDELGVERCAWVGHSMGAQVAIWAALHHPERMSSLVLVAPAGIETFSPIERHALTTMITSGWVMRQRERQLRDALALAFHRVPAEADWLLQRRLRLKGPELSGFAHAFAQGVRAMLDAPVLHRLEEIRAPSLVLFGEQDRLVPNRIFRPHGRPRDVAARAAAGLNAKSVLLPHAGHLLAFEKPEEFIHELLGFLQNAAVPHFDVAAQQSIR